MLPSLLALLCLLALPAPRPASFPDQDDVKAHMAVLRDRDSDPAARQAAMDALLDLDIEGPRQLAAHLGREIKELRDDNEKVRQTLVTAFDQGAQGILEARLDRQGKEEVAELQTAILRLTRSAGLTKQAIVEQSDPALARIEAIVVVTTDAVFAADEALAADYSALRANIARDRLLYDYWRLARGRLAVHPDGGKISRRMKSPGEVPCTEEALAAELDRIARLCTVMTDQDRKVFDANFAQRPHLPASEAEGIEVMNLLRVHLGLRALRVDTKLCRAGRDHSRDMVKHEFFAHESPVEGKETFAKRAALAGTTASSENIAMGQSTPAAAIRGWWHSPGHHKNMLGSHHRAGLGRYQNHWTQLFGQ